MTKYVLAFLVLSIIIFVHEFGHFILAKTSGVTVTEFSIGMGPRILKFKKNGTLYSFKLFFFGGSCRMLGEEEDDSSEGSFNTKSVWKRIAIVAGGPIFNFIFAFIMAIILIGKIGYDPCVIYSVEEFSSAQEAGLEAGDQIIDINGTTINFYGDYSIYMMDFDGTSSLQITYLRDGQEYETEVIAEYISGEVYQMGVYMNSEEPSINSVTEDTPAEEAGLMAGDLIISIDGIAVETTDQVTPLIQTSNGEAITIVVNRNGEDISIVMTPKAVQQSYYSTGMNMSGARVMVSPLKTVEYAFKEVGYWIKTVFYSLKMMFTGQVTVDDVSGPVGIVSAIGTVVDESKNDGALYVFLNLTNWMIMISANLGVMNLLPLPALDGGRLVFLFIEAIRGKPVPREKEGMVHFVGIVLLMILMVFVMYNDIRKLF